MAYIPIVKARGFTPLMIKTPAICQCYFGFILDSLWIWVC
nr:MAG TPA: hypothetical protein [Caudoviricetes sp.]